MASPARLFQKTRNNYKPPKNRSYFMYPPTPYDKKREDPPKCTTCGVKLTIKHIFTECRNNQQDRIETLGATHLYEIFSPESTEIQKTIFFF